MATPEEIRRIAKLIKEDIDGTEVSGTAPDVEGISAEVTPRIILVDERDEKIYAIPFDSEEAVLLPYKKMVIDVMKRYYDFNDGDPELENVKAAKTIEDVGEWSEVLVLEEGEEGVWTGFSSADRNSIGGKLPLEKGEWTGNGDPHFYLTVGKPTGAIVPGIERTEPEEDEEEETQDQEV